MFRDNGYKRGENGVCETTTSIPLRVGVFVVLLVGIATVAIIWICLWMWMKKRNAHLEGKTSRQAVVYA